MPLAEVKQIDSAAAEVAVADLLTASARTWAIPNCARRPAG